MIGHIEVAGAETARGKVRMKVALPDSFLAGGSDTSDVFVSECAVNW
jgi:hypothetical protein